MKKILNIISSINGASSYSTQLSQNVLDKLKNVYPDCEVTDHNISQSPFPYLKASYYEAFYSPPEYHTTEQKEAIKLSDEAVQEIKDADFIVIGVPLYNFGIPSTLKSWIDYITRPGVTFSFNNGNPHGLIHNKKVYLNISTGSVYSEGPLKSFDFSECYLRAILGFIGLTDVTVFRVEGTNIPDLKEIAMHRAIEEVSAYAF